MIGVLALVAAYKDDSSRPTSKPSVTARLKFLLSEGAGGYGGNGSHRDGAGQ